MALARWQRTIVDDAGNILPNAQVTVRRETAGTPLATLKSDRSGLVGMSNPFNADGQGFAAFHVTGGAYQITATLGPFSITWRYVAVGTASETDAGVIPAPTTLSFLFDAVTTDADPGPGKFRLNNASPASATQAFIDNLNSGGADVSARLVTFDDFGNSGNRGVLEIFDPAFPTTVFQTYVVTGTVIDGTGYRKVSLTFIHGAGSFVLNQEYTMVFWARGSTGPLSAVVDDTNPTLGGDLNTNGFDIILQGGEVPLSTGRHTVWVPASSMWSRITGGPSGPTKNEIPGQQIMNFVTFDFDQTTEEMTQFNIAMPTSWDRFSGFTFVPLWYASAGTGGVVFGLSCRSFSSGDTFNVSFGSEVTSARTMDAINRLQKGAESAIVTPDVPTRDTDLIQFAVRRLPNDAGDTLNADARLIGIMLFLRIGAPNDAFGFQS